MPRTKAKNLSSLLQSALKSTTKFTPKPSSLTSPAATATEDRPLNLFVSSLDSKAALLSTSVAFFSHDSSRLKSKEFTGDFGVASEELEEDSSAVDATVSSPKSEGTNNANALETELEIQSFSTVSNINISQLGKKVLHERRQKWISKNPQTHCFEKLVNLSANKLGTDATLNVFGRLGRENCVKEYNSLIRICIERAKDCDYEDVALEQICKAFQLFNLKKEQGFQLEEETYGTLLMYLIDMGMIEEFHFFRKAIDSGNSRSDPRLGYYEMLLWIRVNDEEKIQGLCNCTAIDYEGDNSNLIGNVILTLYLFLIQPCITENYLLALCESKRKREFVQLLETVDITKVSSLDHVMSIFKFLGRLVLEYFAEKYLVELTISDYGAENVSNVIFSYISNIPNLEVEDIISKFRELHAKLEIKPSSASFEKLIAYTINRVACIYTYDKHFVAVDKIEEFLDEIFGAGSTLSIGTLNSILIACEDKCVYKLVQLCQVQRIYSVIGLHNLKPNSETFRSMISLCVRREDFDGAYAMLGDVKKMNLMVTADMYNAIMVGYFRRKDTDGALKVLKQMEKADVKPNSQTFSYLIQNCSNEKDIIKYYEEMTCSGVQVTKDVFMALINAYASCGEFEKAKQVILDKGIPVQSLNEIKGSLVATLASSGQLFDAFVIYEEIKQAGWRLEPKAVRALIEQLHSEEDLSRSIQLLEELDDPKDWKYCCRRLILHCVRLKHLSSAIALLKQLNDYDDELAGDFLFREVFHLIEETEPPNLQFGLDLLRFIKNELHFAPSYKWLRSLRSIFVKEKNIQISRLIWKEFVTTGYSYLNYLCMYEDLLISGDHQGARKILSKIPKGHPNTNELINAIQEVGQAWRRLSLGSTQGPNGIPQARPVPRTGMYPTPIPSEFGDFAGGIPHMP
ncbi:hypothetical protein Pint_16814 [Pistacia integerrima]|uniref:Uncharacterized protein n=1 Tax=Pistacia integerrima TaxID=434235 RepID=A0ACC0ZEY9_9ROSI|nr:hypothetical protein Pint_16814 [Pistacia integerrima]